MSLKFLNENSFTLDHQSGMLNLLENGICFVMFKSDNCEMCKSAFPVFDQLSKQDGRLTFGIVPIDRYRNLIEKSKQTKYPIKVVPTFFLYANGVLKANYKGARDIISFKNFLNEVIPKLNIQKKTFAMQETPITDFSPPQQNNTSQDQSGIVVSKIPVPYNEPYKAYAKKS